ncbi:MAG: methylated-DNA--[protein]-cysteine S-methyltransferase [bacterium]
MCYTTLDSPLGAVLVAGNAAGLHRISFLAGDSPVTPGADWEDREHLKDHPAHPLAEAVRQLSAYFRGELRAFDLPLAPGGTPFQQRVWGALREIPYGETITYGELARRIGQPSASRAVGAANGRNPLPIVVPCHRVIGHNGRLTGFHGGLHLKEGLLNLEEATGGARFSQPSLFS